MPLPFLAPGDLRAAGLDEAGITLTNPLAAEESVLRTSLRPGLLKSVAYNASHRNRRRGPVRDRQGLRPPAAGSAAARRARAAGRGARRRATPPPRSRSGRCWPTRSACQRGPRCDQAPGSPACTRPRRPRSASASDVVGAVGEVDPGVLDAPRHPRAGGLARGRPRPAARPAPRHARPTSPSAATRRATSTWPSWWPSGAGRRGARHHRRGRRASCWSALRLFDVFRSDAAARRHPQPGLHACGSRPTTAPSPTTRSPGSARR